MAFGALKSALYQSSEQQGFNFVVGKKKNACYGVVYTFVCSKFQYYIQEETKRVFDDGNTDSNSSNLYAKGLKVNNVRCNRKIESRGSSGQSLVRKTKTSKSTEKKQRCPFGINIVYGKDGYYYLSSVRRQNAREHCYHIRKTIVFSKTTTMDDHVKKMLETFAVTYAPPSTTVSFLKKHEGKLFNPKDISNVLTKHKNISFGLNNLPSCFFKNDTVVLGGA